MLSAALLSLVLAGVDPRVERVVAAMGEKGCPRLYAMLTPGFQKALPVSSWGPFCDSVGQLSELAPIKGRDGWTSFVAKSPRGYVQLDVGFDGELLSGLRVSPDAAPPSSATSIEDGLRAVRERYKLPGLAAYVRLRDSTALYTVGVRKQGDPTPVSPTDRWHLGSNTKAMTATLAAMLVEEKKLSWSSTVSEVLSDWKDLHSWYKAITLQQLLTHRAGLPRDVTREQLSALFAGKDVVKDRRAAVHELLQVAPATQGTYAYSNAGYLVAAVMLERASGRPWEALLRERLFVPLGMASCGLGAPGSATKVDEPWGHTVGSAGYVPVVPGPRADNPAAYGPAGTVHCSLADWAKFAVMHLDGEHAPTLVSVASMRAMHTAPPGESYAFGWGTGARAWAGRVLTHRGSNLMNRAAIVLAPEKNAVLLVVTNAGDDPNTELAMNEALGVLSAAVK